MEKFNFRGLILSIFFFVGMVTLASYVTGVALTLSTGCFAVLCGISFVLCYNICTMINLLSE